jgi:zinc protease
MRILFNKHFYLVITVFLFLPLILPLSLMADAKEAKSTSEFTLDNGLKILVRQDSRAPIAVLQLWYRVGTSYEHEGITGLSHALEHMMFKGTKNRASGEFENILAVNGATNNAFTSQDYTAYYEVLANDRLEVAMELEADRMSNLVLDGKEFAKEIEVVKEERRWRTDDKPTSLTREQFNATAFLNSPYRSPVIGWMVDLDNMKLEDLQAWYKKWYVPNNATLVVVGDVEPQKVYEMARKYFGAIKSGKLPEVKPRTEVKQKGIRSITVKAPAKVPYLRMGYKTPGLISTRNTKNKWEPYALEVLANILDGGSSARFSRNLIRGQEIAVSAGAGYYGYGRLPDLFVLSGTPSKKSSVEELTKAMLAEIEKLKKEKVSEDEISRVKAQVIAEEVYERDSIEHVATLLGSLETTGIGHELMDEYVTEILKVTPEQVQAVARKYLVEDQLTLARLDPLPIDSRSNKQ